MSHPGTRGHSSVSLRGVLLGILIGAAFSWGVLSMLASEEDRGSAAQTAEAKAAVSQPDGLAGTDRNAAPVANTETTSDEFVGPETPPEWDKPVRAMRYGQSAGVTKLPHPGVVSGKLGRGESLTSALGQYGIKQRAVTELANALKPYFDFRRSRPGDFYQVRLDSDGRIVDFLYTNRPDEPLHAFWNGERYVARVETPRVEIRSKRIAGVIESNLYEAISALGEDPQLANSFSELFVWDLDFRRSVQTGDTFSAAYERRYQIGPDEIETYAGLGRILAARYEGIAGEFTAIYYKPKGKPSGYYRPDGSSLEGKFLFRPVEFGRVSSGWNQARRHPILKTTRPHRGIDWAAPRGTPVWSVASGKIIFRGRAGGRGGGFGNLVKIQHDNGYISYYGHLNGFAGGLKVGDRVRQKQVIGYVGSTGLATGPHVCFRIQKNGSFVNPMKIKSPAAARIAKENWTDFEGKRDEILRFMNGSRLAANESKPSS